MSESDSESDSEFNKVHTSDIIKHKCQINISAEYNICLDIAKNYKKILSLPYDDKIYELVYGAMSQLIDYHVNQPKPCKNCIIFYQNILIIILNRTKGYGIYARDLEFIEEIYNDLNEQIENEERFIVNIEKINNTKINTYKKILGRGFSRYYVLDNICLHDLYKTECNKLKLKY